MKTLLKYITLLIIGGVIIPLYQTATIKAGQIMNTTTALVISTPVGFTAGHSFSFIKDVAAKLLPVLTIFKL